MARKKTPPKKRTKKELFKEIIEDLISKKASSLTEQLIGKKDVNEFLLAKKLKYTINEVRNILYSLSEIGVVESTRKKDKRKGWYIYYWTFKESRAMELFKEKLKEKIAELEQELNSRKETRQYICENCYLEVDEETALLNDFRCQECNTVYTLADNKKVIRQLERKISHLKEDLKALEETSLQATKKQAKKDKKTKEKANKKKKEEKSKQKKKTSRKKN